MSTWLYTGTGAAQTITNGIDLSTKGGLTWIKRRNGANNNVLFDTSRGAGNVIASDSTTAQFSDSVSLTAFNTTGFALGDDSANGNVNFSGSTYVSWTFREQPKFFDVVTWTSTNNANARISHNLGSVPGCYIIKRTDSAGTWFAYHASLGRSAYVRLNTVDGSSTNTNCWGTTDPTTTDFGVNETFFTPGSGNYVAYLFAHNAGGFGLTGTDNVISCGSYAGTGSPVTVTLGYEPQWILIKESSLSGNNWVLIDNMRGMPVGSNDAALFPNLSSAESTGDYLSPTATGFIVNGTLPSVNDAGSTYIYIAIRRGPMKVPTSGTSVFSAKTMTATRADLSITGVGFSPDMVINGVRSVDNYGQQIADRLRGVTQNLFTEYNFTEYTYNLTALKSLDMDGISIGADTGARGWNFTTGDTSVKWMFKRAPSVFDIVCYTGTGANRTLSHNLGVAPELILIKSRSSGFDATYNWWVYSATLGATSSLSLNTTGAVNTGFSTFLNSTSPTSSVFSLGTYNGVNASGATFLTYLFATAAGVSKVGSYTGTGALLTVDCGFTSGARFILIKRTDSTGDWFTYDSTRGITSGNDPYMRLNSAAVEVTGTNYVDTDSTGFKVTAAAPAGLNASGGTYIFLAFA
jgi:hypothetical protein